jgi:choice-of-anchor A domain-containing protein
VRLRIGICACAVVAALPGVASASSLGIASNYNVFVVGSANLQNSDIEGAVAVGGSATFSSYSIAHSLKGISGPSLVVGGGLVYHNGSIYYGDVYVGGAASLSGVTIGDGDLYNPSTLIDFDLALSTLTSESALWSALATTGTVNVTPWKAITLTGTSSTLNVFNLSGADLATCVGLTINAPSGSTVLVNVDGTLAQLSSFGITLNGVTASSVLYNYYQATSLTVSGIGVQGSILAPLASVDFSSGQINGTLIAGSLSGTGESHYVPFTGDLPSVPEPSSLLLMGSGVIGLAGSWLRRRRG